MFSRKVFYFACAFSYLMGYLDGVASERRWWFQAYSRTLKEKADAIRSTSN